MSDIILIAGPTASGKSALALQLAEKSGGVIINADSQQMYRELRVLTARPSPEEEARAPHRLYGVLSAAEACSAGLWLKYACMEIDWALSTGKIPIIVGGTGLYIKALLEGISEIPPIPSAIREQAKGDLGTMGHTAFHARLQEVDPALGPRIKPGDTQRLIRAYEVWLSTGKPLSMWQAQGRKAPYVRERFDIHLVMPPRETVYAKCDARLEAMAKEGAIEEVKQLLTLNLPEDAPALRIIGVPEFAAYLREEIPLEIALRDAQQATRNYAKRQMTWFRHQLVVDL